MIKKFATLVKVGSLEFIITQFIKWNIRRNFILSEKLIKNHRSKSINSSNKSTQNASQFFQESSFNFLLSASFPTVRQIVRRVLIEKALIQLKFTREKLILMTSILLC